MPTITGNPGGPGTPEQIQAETVAAIFTGSKDQQISNVAAYLAKYGPATVTNWKNFATAEAKSDPSLTVQQLLQAWVDTSFVSGLTSGIKAQLNVLGAVANKGLPAVANAVPDINPLNWLNSLGGSIASGLEGAVVAVLKDVWDVIGGAVEIAAGVIIVLLTLGFAFKGDLLAIAGMAGMMK